MRFKMALTSLILAATAGSAAAQPEDSSAIPSQVPPRRSTQLLDGFGMNNSLPREPRLPWARHWWTRMFDSGVKWIRLGQYENSSERTSWDWIEQTPGRYQTTADLDEAIRSLSDNGVQIEIILQYSNALYQGDPGTRPSRVTPPPPGIGEDSEPPDPIFIPPTTEEQIQAFVGYARFMVDRYKARVKHWELWNEPDLGYWRPFAKNREEQLEKAKSYGRLLCRVADAIHEIDPQAKVMTAGFAGHNGAFLRAALSGCAGRIDIVSYHGGFDLHAMPEANSLSEALFRENLVRTTPDIRQDIDFWNNEWSFQQKDNTKESVQARYLPRILLYNHAQGIKMLMWAFVPGTDGNEGDTYGILHGDTLGRDAFQAREGFRAWEVTAALFGQTKPDPEAEFVIKGVPEYSHQEVLQSFAYRDAANGKRIYAFWLAVNADPGDRFAPVEAGFRASDPELRRPILIDVRTGAVTPLTADANGDFRIPLKDSVMAIADASYLDWPLVPAAPWGLQARRAGSKTRLTWKIYGEPQPSEIEIHRSVNYQEWQSVGRLSAAKDNFTEPLPARGHVTYRVRALGNDGPSPWSNPAWIEVD